VNYQQAKIRANVLKALAHPMRVLIVDALRGGDRCVSEITALGTISQSNVSRHLATLNRAGIVSDRRIKNRVVYRLEAPAALDLLDPAAEIARRDIKRRTENSETL
jgi:ArsR family transcriptional regulator, arsenate/arsenite/antimonite-responsive transcriptional repressor